MTRIAQGFLVSVFALLAAAPAAVAQAQRIYSQPELDQMLAPIALYPDALLSQVLMAATYPAEVGEAARWSRAYPGLRGDDAVRAVEYEEWDPSVKSLVAFPQILARMDENPGWTRSLGDAFLMQEPHVMDTVQLLRSRAQAAGNLQSSEQMHVRQQGRAIVVQPASPQYVYVPYYDPLVAYGPWWWPAYRPVVWAPWPGYANPYRPGVSVGFWWGPPVGLSLNFFFGDFDWRQRHVRIVHPSAYYYRPPFVVNRTFVVTPHRWQHEPRRRDVVIQGRPGQAHQQVQAQPQFRREAQRVETQPAQVQARSAPVAAPVAIAAPIRIEARREERKQEFRNDRRDEHRNNTRIERAPAARVQAQPQAQALPQAQPQVRMPAATAPQQPRAERQEQRQERREMRQEQRNERGHKGREGS